MRRTWIGPALFMIALLIGCGDDDPSSPTDPSLPADPQPLAFFDMAAGAGGRSVADTATVAMTIGPDGSEFTLFETLLTADDDSATIVLGPEGNADFDEAVALLTNGENDATSFWRGILGGSVAITGGDEEGFFYGGILAEDTPDLAGAEITGVRIVLDTVVVDSPGGDPNGDGIWTDVWIEGQVVLIGHP